MINLLILSMYSRARRRVSGPKTNFSRTTQPYIFSNLPFESFELDLFSPQKIFLNKKTAKFKILFCIDVVSKFLFTEIVTSKSADTIKRALTLIFKKIDKIQAKFPTSIHLKRICTGKL